MSVEEHTKTYLALLVSETVTGSPAFGELTSELRTIPDQDERYPWVERIAEKAYKLDIPQELTALLTLDALRRTPFPYNEDEIEEFIAGYYTPLREVDVEPQ